MRERAAECRRLRHRQPLQPIEDGCSSWWSPAKASADSASIPTEAITPLCGADVAEDVDTTSLRSRGDHSAPAARVQLSAPSCDPDPRQSMASALANPLLAARAA